MILVVILLKEGGLEGVELRGVPFELFVVWNNGKVTAIGTQGVRLQMEYTCHRDRTTSVEEARPREVAVRVSSSTLQAAAAVPTSESDL